MKSNYKRLGDYIRPVDVRNKDLISTELLGINIDKFFMPSVANIIGTDLRNYKLLSKWQFACNPMHVGRDEKLPIALYLNDSPAIVSPAYFVFEVADNRLLCEYLMLWFRRVEFDRECWFYTDASVRGGITWEAICDMRLPIPRISEQQKIVDAYNIIERRIELKHKINGNLEAQALAIYSEMFVSKCAEEIPDEWTKRTLVDVADISSGGDRPQIFSYIHTSVYNVPIYSNGMEQDGLYGFTDKPKIFKESVTVSARGTVGFTCLRQIPYVPIVRLISIIPRSTKVTAKYLYFFLKSSMLTSSGTSQQQLTVPDFENIQIIVPTEAYINQFSMRIEPIFACLNKGKAEVRQLVILENALLTQLSSR